MSHAFSRVLVDYIHLYKSVSKLSLVLMGLFIGLYRDGFCRPPEEKDGAGEGGGEISKDLDGTGMAEGVGEKDVSDQIENEDQIMGTDKENKVGRDPQVHE